MTSSELSCGGHVSKRLGRDSDCPLRSFGQSPSIEISTPTTSISVNSARVHDSPLCSAPASTIAARSFGVMWSISSGGDYSSIVHSSIVPKPGDRSPTVRRYRAGLGLDGDVGGWGDEGDRFEQKSGPTATVGFRDDHPFAKHFSGGRGR